MKSWSPVVGAVLLLGVVVAVVLWIQPPSRQEPTFCTKDAKKCSDGSVVGRVPPACEFAACPETDLRDITLYFYSAAKDSDNEGNIQCSREGMVGVSRKIPVSTNPIQDAIRLLLKGELTGAERTAGITTEYPLPGVELVGAALRDSVLTLEFRDPQNKTGGGSCRVGILWYQIEATALQFPEVREVKFVPEELFQP